MAMIMTGVMSAAYVSEADEKTVADLEKFAYDIGIAFQIRDDFEDEEQDSGAEHICPNFINILGKDAARRRMEKYVSDAYEIIGKYKNNEFIVGLLSYLFG